MPGETDKANLFVLVVIVKKFEIYFQKTFLSYFFKFFEACTSEFVVNETEIYPGMLFVYLYVLISIIRSIKL